MTLGDFTGLAVENLLRIRFRSALTIAGVAIAIAAFVAMLSFGAGNQKFITDMYTEFGLFTTLNVYPKQKADTDSLRARPLDREALAQFSRIPGVVMAFPFVSFEVEAEVADTNLMSRARALPSEALETRMFSKILGGSAFSSDTASEAIVTHSFLKQLGIDSPDSLLGREIIISAYTISLDSAVLNVIGEGEANMFRRLRKIEFDSLFEDSYRNSVMKNEMNEGLKRFVDGLIDKRKRISDTLSIIGVGDESGSRNRRIAPIFIPDKTARRLGSSGFGLGSSPTDFLAAMKTGKFFSSEEAHEYRHYPQITIELDPYASHDLARDSIEALGFEVFSYTDDFKEIKRFFFYYNAGLAAIGLIALITAALGIMNTMAMSILERRKEIGVLKALGAEDMDIKKIFLVESGLIGLFGSIVGLMVGWIGTRIASAIMQAIMEAENIPKFDPFALPVWLIALALAFGLIVAFASGLYPATRAAKVDPIVALRGD